MGLLSATSIVLADKTSPSLAANVMQSFVSPVISVLAVVATLACVLFIIIGGYQYMTSSGKPNNLENAKKIIRNALIGLIIILAASALTAILTHAYGNPGSGVAEKIPALTTIQPNHDQSSLVGVIISAITGLLANIITSIAVPFLDALKYFITSTPLMAANGSVFKLWLTILGITDVLFVLLIALLGFRIMSFATLGLDEIEFKHLLPQIGLIFLLANTSIFAIDGVISLSNAMIHALNSVYSPVSVWTTLTTVANQANVLSIAALLIMVFFLILVVCLLVYYVGRLVALYLGAVLSPLVCVLWLVPGFKDFAENAAKVYLATIFVLFIHVVILQLAASIFTGLALTGPSNTPDPIMALIVGLATILALLKTQGLLMQLSYVSIGPKTVRKLGGQFITGISYMSTRSPGLITQARNSVMLSTTRVNRSLSASKIITKSPLKISSKATAPRQSTKAPKLTLAKGR
jgi:hypothetical protein